MKKPFTALTRADVQKLRRKVVAVLPLASVQYAYTKADVEAAVNHLKALYPGCRVTHTFAAKILLLNDIY